MSRGKEVKELREKMGMNRREFSEYYGIPYRTVQDWEAEKREQPDYLLRLLKYQAEIESRVKKDKSQGLFFLKNTNAMRANLNWRITV